MESFFYEEIFWEMKVKDSVLTQKRDYAKRELRQKKRLLLTNIPQFFRQFWSLFIQRNFFLKILRYTSRIIFSNCLMEGSVLCRRYNKVCKQKLGFEQLMELSCYFLKNMKSDYVSFFLLSCGKKHGMDYFSGAFVWCLIL